MSSQNQDAVKRRKTLELIDAVMDCPDHLTDDELDELHRHIRPGQDAKSWLRAAATKAAQSYRLKKERVPYHVQAVLDATKPPSAEEGWSPSLVMDLVNSLLSRKGASRELPPAKHPRQAQELELSEKDRAILQDISDEVRNQRDSAE